MKNIRKLIDTAWEDRSLLSSEEITSTVENVIELLDKGQIRVSQYIDNKWVTNDWIKKAIILYFIIRRMKTYEIGMLEFHDKIPIKHNY